ncbi:hypothetical protein CYLTODRAFT_492915 [Cylindrobasidium torrendii FP15055 ss-10]|uniref:Transcription activator of gluconeogenesis ERT1 n=1 Tax=Cylindrobasidium torrendii FP15055 ss-10 TaxID=1314674 RepID=A0A0D7B2D7_9AGAR|nr:hypothetical protein CYLTODRAFT_492915 [Cylindrobasidium torrendii FP15055 ss-10]
MATEATSSPKPSDASPVYPLPNFAQYPVGTFPPPLPPGLGPNMSYPPMFYQTGPMPDGENALPPPPPGAILMYHAVPGVMIAYPPPPPQPFAPPQPSPSAPVETKQKRKQVKMACTNCAQACKRCDDARPCERCVKYGFNDTCVDGQRKERQKGVKRGPYKRRAGRESSLPDPPEFSPPPLDPSAPAPPPPLPPTDGDGNPLPPPPDGVPPFYPLYYQPGHFMPMPPEGQDGSSQMYIVPGPYPYPPPFLSGLPPPPPETLREASPAAHIEPVQTPVPIPEPEHEPPSNGTVNPELVIQSFTAADYLARKRKTPPLLEDESDSPISKRTRPDA